MRRGPASTRSSGTRPTWPPAAGTRPKAAAASAATTYSHLTLLAKNDGRVQEPHQAVVHRLVGPPASTTTPASTANCWKPTSEGLICPQRLSAPGEFNRLHLARGLETKKAKDIGRRLVRESLRPRKTSTSRSRTTGMDLQRLQMHRRDRRAHRPADRHPAGGDVPTPITSCSRTMPTRTTCCSASTPASKREPGKSGTTRKGRSKARTTSSTPEDMYKRVPQVRRTPSPAASRSRTSVDIRDRLQEPATSPCSRPPSREDGRSSTCGRVVRRRACGHIGTATRCGPRPPRPGWTTNWASLTAWASPGTF